MFLFNILISPVLSPHRECSAERVNQLVYVGLPLKKNWSGEEAMVINIAGQALDARFEGNIIGR